MNLLRTHKAFLLFLFLFGQGIEVLAFAKEHDVDPALRPIDQEVLNHQTQSKQVFATLPGLHFSPKNNRMIFSLGLNRTDLKAQLVDDHSSVETLDIDAYNINPFIGFSSRSFGLGISGDIGEGGSTYRRIGANEFYRERSIMRYQGGGLHAFYNPTPGASLAFLTFVSGIKILEVKHKAKAQNQNSNDDADWVEKNYEAIRFHIGAHFTINLGSSFALIPWANAIYTETPNLDRAKGIKSDQLLDQRLNGDADIILGRGTRQEYGIDAAVRMKHFEIHFGNLIGAILAERKNEKSPVSDRSFSVSVTIVTPDRRSK